MSGDVVHILSEWVSKIRERPDVTCVAVEDLSMKCRFFCLLIHHYTFQEEDFCLRNKSFHWFQTISEFFSQKL